ncbi:MAG TPA: PH domain-containing protein [Candidatus Solibacter sp.]|jgi:uncharacterized membrane protein YdbT with pleckstrin-like domain|nr:PH domain-containing protein [Candidatus Solibacter sp.]
MSEDKDLIPGEVVQLRTNRHPLVLVRQVLVPTLVVLALAIGLALLPLPGSVRSLRWLAVLLLLLGLFVYLDVQYIVWRSVTYTITDQRILLRRGVLGKFSRSIGMSRVQDVSTSQSLFGRMFDYGNVEIESAGKDGAEILIYVPDPQHFRDVLFEHLHGQPATSGAPI